MMNFHINCFQTSQNYASSTISQTEETRGFREALLDSTPDAHQISILSKERRDFLRAHCDLGFSLSTMHINGEYLCVEKNDKQHLCISDECL